MTMFGQNRGKAARSSVARTELGAYAVIVGFGLVLLAASTVGHFSTVLIAGVGTLFVLLAWGYPRFGSASAVVGLALLSIVYVVPALRPTEINYGVYVAILLFAVGLFALMQRHAAPPPWFFAFLIWVLITGFFTVIRADLEQVYLPFVIPLMMLGTYLLVACSDDRLRTFFVNVLLALAVAQAVIAVCQTTLDWPTFTSPSGLVRFEEPRNYFAFVFPWISRTVRMGTGTYEHFNGFGALVAMAAPLALARWRSARSGRTFMVFAVIMAGVVASFSRGALIGSLLGMSALVILEVRDRGAGLRRAAFTSLGLLIALGAWNSVLEYGAATQNVSGRVLTWEVALAYALQDPFSLLLGYGHSFFAYFLVVLRGFPDRLHSAPLQVALETGVIGIVLLGGSLITGIRNGLRGSGWLAVGCATAVIAFMAHQLVDNSLLAYNGAWFAGVLAIAATALPAAAVEEEDV